MANYNFDRFTVLVVDENSYMRSLMTMALKALGIGTVKTAKDGGDAIDLLRLMEQNPMKAGMLSVDIVFSAWDMSPVDGMMLLRWIRRHKESPDRFIPFVMVTGHAEPDNIREMRDMGVTEVLAMPFSVNGVASRLLQVVDRPRQFVHTSDYFGPDRRRQNIPSGLPERRVLTDDHPQVEIVYD